MSLSPMMSHYLHIKEKYKDCIVFYRLGDFYEMFFDDAIKASGLLELTLTGRDCGLDERAPMCGIPFHACDEYISKLVSMGEKVAICEQLTKPTKDGKTLVERDVIKVVTAGTVTNTELLDDKENNFLASIYLTNNAGALAWADLTTGEFYAKSFTCEDYLNLIFNELVRINPVEIIGNQKAVEILNNSPLITQRILPKVQSIAESEFNITSATKTLSKQLGVVTFSQYGIDDGNICICPSGALISYFIDTQKTLLSNITSIILVDDKKFMMLDFNSIRNLELIKTLRDNKRYGSLIWVLDKTVTNMGARKLQSWILSPLNEINDINYRLGAVETFFNDNMLRDSLRDTLKQVKDVKRLSGKISNGNLFPKDCLALAKSLEVLPSVKFQLSGSSSKCIQDISYDLKDFTSFIEIIKSAIYDDNGEQLKTGKNSNIKYIKEGYNAELDRLRNLFINGKGAILEIERKERERTGIKTLKVSYNRVFGYYIEVTNSFKEKVPYDYIRRQTLANCERYITEELKDLESQIISAEERFYQLELALYAEVKNKLLTFIPELQVTADAIAILDVLLSFATVAKDNDYVKPCILDNDKPLSIKDGRHPVVEKASKQRFIPNDCEMDSYDNLINVITGPNMAGKSTYMRQVALIIIMAHIGCYVPASKAYIPLTDRVFTRIGASDNLIFNQSTFMVEMGEMATILNGATNSSFLILDEIGRGTSTFDGLSIAWSIIEYLSQKIKAKTLFATHYHELTELEGVISGVKNYKITIKEFNGNIIFLRKIVRGGANKSFGIEVAQLAGIDKVVIDRAKQILKKLEKNDLVSSRQPLNDEKNAYSNEIEEILKNIDVNDISPIKAFNLICELTEKARGNDE